MKGCDEGTILVPPEEGEMRCEVVFDDGPMVTVPLKHLEASHEPAHPRAAREWSLQKRLCKTRSSDNMTGSKRVVKTHVDGGMDREVSCTETSDVNPELSNTRAGESLCYQDENTVDQERALAELALEFRACQEKLQVAEAEAGGAKTQVGDAASEVQRLSRLLAEVNTECSALLLEINSLETKVTACQGANGIVNAENAQLTEDMNEMIKNVERLRELQGAIKTRQRKEEEKLASLNAAWLNELEDNVQKLKCEKKEQEHVFLQEINSLKAQLTSLLNGKLINNESNPLPVTTFADSPSVEEIQEVNGLGVGVTEEQENPLSGNPSCQVTSKDSQSEKKSPEVNFPKAELTSRHSSPPSARIVTDLSSEQERHREQLLQHMFHMIRKQFNHTHNCPPRTSVTKNLPSGKVSGVPVHQASPFTNHRSTYPYSKRLVGNEVGSPSPPQPAFFRTNDLTLKRGTTEMRPDTSQLTKPVPQMGRSLTGTPPLCPTPIGTPLTGTLIGRSPVGTPPRCPTPVGTPVARASRVMRTPSPSPSPGTSTVMGASSMRMGTPPVPIGTLPVLMRPTPVPMGTPSAPNGIPPVTLGTPTAWMGTPPVPMGTPPVPMGTPPVPMGTPPVRMGSSAQWIGISPPQLGTTSLRMGRSSLRTSAPPLQIHTPQMRSTIPCSSSPIPSLSASPPPMTSEAKIPAANDSAGFGPKVDNHELCQVVLPPDGARPVGKASCRIGGLDDLLCLS